MLLLSVCQEGLGCCYWFQTCSSHFNLFFFWFPFLDNLSIPRASYGDLETALSNVDGRPRILLMGPRRSGKSSIQKVVFHKMSPHETLFLESTMEIRVKDISNNDLVNFQILDFPGSFDFFSEDNSQLAPQTFFKGPGSLVYVIDGQDEETYAEAIDYFVSIAKVAYKVCFVFKASLVVCSVYSFLLLLSFPHPPSHTCLNMFRVFSLSLPPQYNPKMRFDVLIHKVDGDSYLSDDHKIGTLRCGVSLLFILQGPSRSFLYLLEPPSHNLALFSSHRVLSPSQTAREISSSRSQTSSATSDSRSTPTTTLRAYTTTPSLRPSARYIFCCV